MAGDSEGWVQAGSSGNGEKWIWSLFGSWGCRERKVPRYTSGHFCFGYMSSCVKWVVICIGLNLSSCRRHWIEVISYEARGQKRSLKEKVYNEEKIDKKTKTLIPWWAQVFLLQLPLFLLSKMIENQYLLSPGFSCLVTKSCPILCNPMDCSLPGSSVHGISQARILEWVAIPSSRGSCLGSTHVSCIAGGFFTAEPPGKPLFPGTWD